VPGSTEEMVYEFVVVEISDTQGYWFVMLDIVVRVLFTVTAKYNSHYMSRNYVINCHILLMSFYFHISIFNDVPEMELFQNFKFIVKDMKYKT
jgi:uncharacterized integral membrane protein